MAVLQSMVNGMRRIFPRGWAPLLSSVAHIVPGLQRYKALLSNGDQIYLDLREKMCFGIFFHGSQPHEAGTETLLKGLLNKGDVFVDIGANLGYYTRIGSKIVGSEGAVLAFEPMPAAIRLLKMNVADLSNVTIFPIALSERKGEATFYVRKHGNLSSLAPDPLSGTVRVDVSLLDEVLWNYDKVDFIKIDVEGFEKEVLLGAKKTLSVHHPIVYFELEQCFATERDFSLSTFELFFREFNYTLRWINHSGTGSTLVSDIPSNYVIAVPQTRMDLLL